MKSAWTYCFILFLTVNAFAQTQKSLVVIDSVTRRPIDNVSVRSHDGRYSVVSNSYGQATVSLAAGETFDFYKLGYHKKRLQRTLLAAADTIVLSQRMYSLPEVSIERDALEPVIKNKRFFIDDYEHLPSGDFLVITSKINVKGFDVAWYRPETGLRSRITINEGDGRLYTDCFGNIHIVTDKYSRQVYFTSDSTFEFLPAYSRGKFDSTIAQCVLNLDTQVVVSVKDRPVLVRQEIFDVTVNPQSMTYMRVNRRGAHPLITIYQNERMREMMENEFADNQMFGGSPVAAAASMLMFFRSIAKPVSAPLFKRNDTIVLFDPQEKRVLLLSQSGEIMKNTPLDPKSFSTYHDVEIIHDGATGYYYKSANNDHLVLRRIDISSGQLGPELLLRRRFAKKVTIRNGSVYYLSKENGWDDTCYLYRQSL